jgi:integrase
MLASSVHETGGYIERQQAQSASSEGKPFTANGFGNKKDWCRQADLPHCSAHGVRKATSTALAEAGATPHEIMAITGHQTLEEVERYTKAASHNNPCPGAP